MLSFFEMEKLVYIQTNLRMLESMGIDDAIQDEILMKVTLPKFFLCIFDWKLKFNFLLLIF